MPPPANTATTFMAVPMPMGARSIQAALAVAFTGREADEPPSLACRPTCSVLGSASPAPFWPEVSTATRADDIDMHRKMQRRCILRAILVRTVVVGVCDLRHRVVAQVVCVTNATPEVE